MGRSVGDEGGEVCGGSVWGGLWEMRVGRSLGG